MGKLQVLIIHCSATPEGKEYTGAQIKAFHMSPPPAGRGWDRPGYSDIIHLNGAVENLRKYDENDIIDMYELTYGAGYMNPISRHICYIGGMDKQMKNAKDTRTNLQKFSLQQYVYNMIKLHPDIKIAAHYQFAPKACPSFDVEAWLKSINVADKNIYTIKK
jgi:N-acetylmuramoyl-L-alanine amidase